MLRRYSRPWAASLPFSVSSRSCSNGYCSRSCESSDFGRPRRRSGRDAELCSLVLYLVYFPRHLKYQRVLPLPDPAPTAYGAVANGHSHPSDETDVVSERVDGYQRPVHVKLDTTPEWRLAITLAWVVAIHLSVPPTLLDLVKRIGANRDRTLLLLLTLAILTINRSGRLTSYLAIFLGLSGTALAILQYAPQIYKTYNAKLVGALSLGTMAIQVPGSVLFVISIAVRPGTNWTSWIPYAVTGAMQGALLVSIRFLASEAERD